MPLYDFRFGDQHSPNGVQRRGVRALDLVAAKEIAIAWAKTARFESGNSADLSNWPLIIVAGEDTEDHKRGTALFARDDVRPDDWPNG